MAIEEAGKEAALIKQFLDKCKEDEKRVAMARKAREEARLVRNNAVVENLFACVCVCELSCDQASCKQSVSAAYHKHQCPSSCACLLVSGCAFH